MYLKKDCDITKISEGLQQVFQNNFTLNIGKKEIVKMKNDNVLTNRDLDIAKFLFRFRFATLNQIHTFLEISGDESSFFSILNRLNKLVNYRIVNRFMLTKDLTIEKIMPESLEVFCLDLGGRYLLSHYSNEDTSDWYTTENMKDSGIVNKRLSATNFYLSLAKNVRDRLSFFNVEPDVRVGKSNVIPSFDLCLDMLGNKSYFVGEVVRDFDFPVYFKDRAFKLESLFETNAWKKYYYDSPTPPVLLIIADSDEIAYEVSKLITSVTEMNRFRVTTDDRIKRPLHEEGAFLRYSKSRDVLEEIQSVAFKP